MKCIFAEGIKQVTFQNLIIIYLLLGILLFGFGWKKKANLMSLTFSYIGYGILGYGIFVGSNLLFFTGLFISMVVDFIYKITNVGLKSALSSLMTFLITGLFALRNVSGVFPFIAIAILIIELVVSKRWKVR